MLSSLVLSLAISSASACPDEAAAAHTSTASAAASTEKKSGCQMPSGEATTAALPADGTHAFLAVSGMHCGACADKVHTALIGVDGVNYYRAPRLAGGYSAWPFDFPQYLLLNIAIGGVLGGTVDNAIFPVTLEIDHVRVYQKR